MMAREVTAAMHDRAVEIMYAEDATRNERDAAAMVHTTPCGAMFKDREVLGIFDAYSARQITQDRYGR